MTTKNLTIEQRNLACLTQLSLSISNIKRIALGKSTTLSISKQEMAAAGIEPEQSISDSLAKIIGWMGSHYPCQLTYKHRIAKKILIGKHSLRTSSFINEFRVARSVADCVITNGKSSVYEIKTELDDPSKLRKQINDYQKAFCYIYLVVKEGYESKYIDALEENSKEVGLLAFRKNGCLATIREAKEQPNGLDIETMFSALTKPEYTTICEQIIGHKLAFTDASFFPSSLEIAKTISPEEFSRHFYDQLRARRVKQHKRIEDKVFLPILPMLTSINPTSLQLNRIEAWLRSEVH